MTGSKETHIENAHRDSITESPKRPTLTVGIGASAGGLKAFTDFLSALPPGTDMAYVLVQHLAPDHESALAEILGRTTATPVREALDGASVEPNSIYVIPPNASLTIKDGVLRLDRPAPPRDLRRPVDTFLVSLAEDQKERAVCIILSGMGSDGAQGVRAIKENGGLAIAQSEFDHVPLGGMPESAAATGFIDEVIPIEAMHARLAKYAEHLAATADKKGSDGFRTDIAEQIPAIARLLRAKVGHDFSGYKENTLLRRVQRRMQVLDIGNVSAYVECLRKFPQQVELLFKDLIIGVTQFFRDPEAFEALETRGLPLILAAKTAGDPIRVWVPGCATGEEVYSIAILMREALERADLELRVQIFGTDIDEKAVAFARAAQYRRITDISADRLKRWFVEVEGTFTPVKEVREMCVFSLHSIIKDPPFSRLDLISCRNLLIYLNSQLQDRVLQSFHYGLNPEGLLFLGPSEGISRLGDAFTIVDKEKRLFQRLSGKSLTPNLSYVPPLQTAPRDNPILPMAKDDWIDRNVRRALEKHSPAYVVIDQNDHIVQFSGSETRNYLEPSTGSASLNVHSLLNKTLRPTVREAMLEARTKKAPVILGGVGLLTGPGYRSITIIVSPILDTKLMVLAFRDDGAIGSPDAAPLKAGSGEHDLVVSMGAELAGAKAHLQSALDDLEIAKEEMRVAVEEHQSVNEELQSSNEELETAKEEMQSINEELHAINAEMIRKNDRLTSLNNDLNNLLDSTQIATLFLGPDLSIRNFTPAMTDILHLRASDRGRPVTDIVSMLAYESLREDVDRVLRDLATVEREVQLNSGRMAFLLRIRPYRTTDSKVDGVVMTFIDVTERRLR